MSGLALVIGCGGPPALKSGGQDRAGEGNPLGPSYVLIPLPTEEASLLGRILPGVPEPGRSLEETARANPCAAKLNEPTTTPLANTFEDAQEVSASASAKAMLGAFGFSGDVNRATHFVYKLDTQKRTGMTDTAEYDACCKEKGCGYGYISALIYGEGEYSTGEETGGSGGVNVAAIGSASGAASLKILHKRKVKGWLAAVITVTDKKAGEQLGPLGVAAAAGITEASVPDTVKVLYEKDKIAVEGSGTHFFFKDGRGEQLTENVFVRRFHEVTGSNELDDFDQRRNKFSFYLSGSLLALSLGTAVYGYTHLTRPCAAEDVDDSDCSVQRGDVFSPEVGYDPNKTVTNGTGIALAGLGTLGTIGFGIWFLSAAFGFNGGVHDHYLSDKDAVLFANKYNRSLLRRTIKQVQKAHSAKNETPRLGSPPLRLEPQIGLTGFGLVGRF